MTVEYHEMCERHGVPINGTPYHEISFSSIPRYLPCPGRGHCPASPFVIDAAHLERQREFSVRTFGPGPRRNGVLAHIEKELDEIRETEGGDASEWADVVILALDGALRAGHVPQAVLDAILAKQELNERRKWPDPANFTGGEAIEHIRDSGDPYANWDEHSKAHDTERSHTHNQDGSVTYHPTVDHYSHYHEPSDLLVDYPPDVR